eukprot:SAG11_NODE_9778_length_881_cov_1.265985_2_plen_116_part_01
MPCRSGCLFQFEVNEKLACLGYASPAYADPFTQTSTMALMPMMVNAIQTIEGRGDDEPWSTWDAWAWEDLMKDDPDGTVRTHSSRVQTHLVHIHTHTHVHTHNEIVHPRRLTRAWR